MRSRSVVKGSMTLVRTLTRRASRNGFSRHKTVFHTFLSLPLYRERETPPDVRDYTLRVLRRGKKLPWRAIDLGGGQASGGLAVKRAERLPLGRRGRARGGTHTKRR